jgi:G:T/U-mismatch repair DNA glycosylase
LIETHPFGSFVPIGARYLLLGSFTTKEAFDDEKKEAYKWFYSNGGRNQFWPMLEEIYRTKLQNRNEMQELFGILGMAIADIIYQCERKNSSNLDINLINIVYATIDITKILENNQIGTIFFTSRYVETKFRRFFKELINRHPDIILVTLPSPSPRYVQMTKEQKIKIYREQLPQLSA